MVIFRGFYFYFYCISRKRNIRDKADCADDRGRLIDAISSILILISVAIRWRDGEVSLPVRLADTAL